MVDVDHLHQLLTVPTLKWRTRRSEGPPQLTDNVAEVQAFGSLNPAASVLRLQRQRLHGWPPAGLADAGHERWPWSPR